MPTRKKKKTTVPKPYKMEVEVELTLEDWKERAQELASIQAKLGEIDAALTKAKESAKEAKAEHSPRIRELWAMLDSGKETRELKVKDRRNLPDGKIETVRCDTGELIATRDMTDKERQTDLEADGYANE